MEFNKADYNIIYSIARTPQDAQRLLKELRNEKK
jgi:hypothetical protein